MLLGHMRASDNMSTAPLELSGLPGFQWQWRKFCTPPGSSLETPIWAIKFLSHCSWGRQYYLASGLLKGAGECDELRELPEGWPSGGVAAVGIASFGAVGHTACGACSCTRSRFFG